MGKGDRPPSAVDEVHPTQFGSVPVICAMKETQPKLAMSFDCDIKSREHFTRNRMMDASLDGASIILRFFIA